jgi:hypothetical protein
MGNILANQSDIIRKWKEDSSMIEVQKMIDAGNRFYNYGSWDKAERCYERAIEMCDLKINLFKRDRVTIQLLEKKVEAVIMMAEISESLHREDDAERFDQLSREIVEYLQNKKHQCRAPSL